MKETLFLPIVVENSETEEGVAEEIAVRYGLTWYHSGEYEGGWPVIVFSGDSEGISALEDDYEN